MISLSRFVEVQKWKICPVQFFSDFKDTVQSDGIRQWPYLPALDPSVSPHAVPTVQIRKLKPRGCDRSLPGDHSSKGGAAEISKSPSVLGCNTRASGAADACLVFFCAKSCARDGKQNEIQHRLFLSSSLQHLLSHTLLALVLFLFLEKIDASRHNLPAPGSLQIVLSHAHESCFLSVTRNHLSCCHLLFFSYR